MSLSESAVLGCLFHPGPHIKTSQSPFHSKRLILCQLELLIPLQPSNHNMKSILALPAIIGAVSAAAVPHAQSPCVSNGRSTAPEPAVNTLAGFNESVNYSMLARNATKPEGYELIMSDTTCALSSSKYMRYSRMSSYDSQTCAKMCDSHPGCDTCTLNPHNCPVSSALLILFKSTST